MSKFFAILTFHMSSVNNNSSEKLLILIPMSRPECGSLSLPSIFGLLHLSASSAEFLFRAQIQVLESQYCELLCIYLSTDSWTL